LRCRQSHSWTRNLRVLSISKKRIRFRLNFDVKSKVLHSSHGSFASHSQELLSYLIHLRTNDISEKQLAQIALGIHQHWDVPTFVKMHEIVIVDDDLDDIDAKKLAEEFETGVYEVFEYLDILHAFQLRKAGRSKFLIQKVPGARLPQWMEDIEAPQKIPGGTFACPHCGRFFRTDIELSMHTKIHYIV